MRSSPVLAGLSPRLHKVIFVLLSVPLPTSHGFQLSQPIALTLPVHDTTILALLETFIVGYLFALLERGFVCFRTGVGGFAFDVVELDSFHAC